MVAQQPAPTLSTDMLTASALLVLLGSAVFSLLCWQLFRRYRHEYLKVLGASWLCNAIGTLAYWLAMQRAHTPTSHSGVDAVLLSMVTQAGYYLHVLLLLCATWALWRGKAVSGRRLMIAVAVILAFCAVVSFTTTGAPFKEVVFWRVGLRRLVTAAAFLGAAGLLLLHWLRNRRLGHGVACFGFVCGGLLSIGHYVALAAGLGLTNAMLPYLAPAEVLTIAVIALGLVLWMLENQHDAVEGSNHELSERTQVLLQSQKMESIGQLASGVAHDFNNVLTVVIGNAESLMRNPDLPRSARGSLEDIRNASLQAAKMTTQLLALARNKAGSARVLDLNREICDLKPLLERLVGSRIRIELDPSPAPCPAMLMRGHIEQILINLIVNARDAIPDTGTVVIGTAIVDVSDGRRVQLTATDTGVGMPEEVRKRVGEPFFTTKSGRGTGIGMASVRSILEQCAGRMEIRSTVGKGTTITISWPAATESVDLDAAAEQHLLPRPRAATILLAEDDPLVRSVTQKALESAGYHVLAADCGQQAAAIARDHPHEIDLLLSDVVMPDLAGPQLAELLTVQRPGTRVAFISGYVDQASSRIMTGEAPLLGKPFTRQELLSFVASVLTAGNQDVSTVKSK